jgi:hypothetical protein
MESVLILARKPQSIAIREKQHRIVQKSPKWLVFIDDEGICRAIVIQITNIY